MSKTITIRVSKQEYDQIVTAAKTEHRTISNFMLHATLNALTNKPTTDNAKINKETV